MRITCVWLFFRRLKVVDTSLLQIVALEFLDLSANRIARVLNSTRWALDRMAIEDKRYARWIKGSSAVNPSQNNNNNNNHNQSPSQAVAILGPQAQTSGSKTGSGSGNGQSQSQSVAIGLPAASASTTYLEKVTVLVYGNDFTGAFERAAWPLVPQLTQITDLKETILAVSRCAPPRKWHFLFCG